jgi:hypothetical protein
MSSSFFGFALAGGGYNHPAKADRAGDRGLRQVLVEGDGEPALRDDLSGPTGWQTLSDTA